MPTIFSHPAVPLGIAVGLGSAVIPKPLLLAGALASVLPDLDVLAFTFGIPYEHEFGHRGVSHSFAFAGLVALLGACARRILQTSFMRAFFLLFVTTASHGILDAFTDGGLGVALFWPWSEHRLFSPFRPIRVSPIGISHFLLDAPSILLSEILWVWIPCLLGGTALAALRRLI
jgi:inner membrane protein